MEFLCHAKMGLAMGVGLKPFGEWKAIGGHVAIGAWEEGMVDTILCVRLQG